MTYVLVVSVIPATISCARLACLNESSCEVIGHNLLNFGCASTNNHCSLVISISVNPFQSCEYLPKYCLLRSAALVVYNMAVALGSAHSSRSFCISKFSCCKFNQ